MYAIFVQGRLGLAWMGNADSLDDATAQAEDFRSRADVEFVIVTPLAHFVDIDGEREHEPIE